MRRPLPAFMWKSWRETYPGIIPDDVLAGLDVSEKAAMWANSLAAPGLDVFVGGAGEDALTGFGCCGARGRRAGQVRG